MEKLYGKTVSSVDVVVVGVGVQLAICCNELCYIPCVQITYLPRQHNFTLVQCNAMAVNGWVGPAKNCKR